MIDKVDQDGDGTVNYMEFKDMMSAVVLRNDKLWNLIVFFYV